MKKLFLLFAVMAMAVAGKVNATVSVTAPEVPAFLGDSIISGTNYYILNVNTQYSIGDESNYYCIFSTAGLLFKVNKQDSGNYTFGYNNGSMHYVESYYNYLYWGGTTNQNISYAQFNVVKNNGLYRIQNASVNDRYYDENCWWGMRDGRYVYYNGVSNLDWYFIPESAYNDSTQQAQSLIYVNKVRLYNAIVSADEKGLVISPYEAIYNDATKTAAELRSAAVELEGTISFTENNSYIFPDWNDYKIGIYSPTFSRYYDASYMRAEWDYNTQNTSKSISATVNITEPSTFVISTHTPNNGDLSWCPMSMEIYVDDSLTYVYDAEMYYSTYYEYMEYDLAENYDNIIQNNYNTNWKSSILGSRRHFVDLPDGEHRLEIKFTNNEQVNNDRRVDIYEIGIEKTPWLSVNVAAEGRLGDEVLRALDNIYHDKANIRDVRKLKISGKMGTADWEQLKTMTSLFALDLSETNITSVPGQFFSRITNPSYTSFLNQVKLPKAVKTIGYEAFLNSYVKDMDMPDSLETVGRRAFAYSYISNAIMPKVKTIYSYAFQNCYNLKTVVTNNLESLGQRAFQYCHNIDSLQLYGPLKTVPYYAFSDCREIRGVSLSDSIETIQHYGFYYNNNSRLNKLPKNLKTINSNGLLANWWATFALPEGLKTVEEAGLQSAARMNGELPSSLTSIGVGGMRYAWYNNCLDTLHLLPNCSYSNETFRYARIKHIDIPENFYSLTQSLLFANNDSLKSVRLNSPIKASVASDCFSGRTKSSITVYVPSYLYYDYRKDNYWGDFNIEPFSTTEMDSIVIRSNLTLSQHDRFEGTPSVSLWDGKTFTLEGSAGMDLKNMTLSANLTNNAYAQLWTSTDSVKVKGDMSQYVYTAANKWYFISLPFDCNLSRTENPGHYAIRYYDGAGRAKYGATTYPESAHNYELYQTEANSKKYFSYAGASKLTLTFSSSTATDNSYHKIYIRDAAGNTYNYYGNIGRKTLEIAGDRFEIWMVTSDFNYDDYRRYGYSFESIYADSILVPKSMSNWKNYDVANDIIKAGTGFIYMTSQDSWTRFYSVDNGTKHAAFFSADNVNNEQHFELQKHECDNSAHRGWNLIGNPYPNYYNNHKISFAAPITLWRDNTYQAYSLRDDDIAIRPLEAIFVQCPEALSEISFPSAGRQLTSTISDQANAPARGAMAAEQRYLVDVSLASTDGTSDNTRIVINNEASVDYEISCDASKFMSMDTTVPQIYSLGSGVKYAINERPLADGSIALGTYIPADGNYTISLARNKAEQVLLTDNETGMTVDITNADYDFTAKAGSADSRFILSFIVPEVTEETTGIDSVASKTESAESMSSIYTLDGRKVNKITSAGIYVVRSGDTSRKIVVK